MRGTAHHTMPSKEHRVLVRRLKQEQEENLRTRPLMGFLQEKQCKAEAQFRIG